MLRQIKWGVQNGAITKKVVLLVTTSFLGNILFPFKNFLERVDLMYQLDKCQYSYFL